MKDEHHAPQDHLKKWITEAGCDTPDEGFHLDVLKKIEVLPQKSPVYQPVIAPWAWTMIVGLIVFIVAASTWTPPSPTAPSSFTDVLQHLKLTVPQEFVPNFALPSLDLSPPFVIGLLAFSILAFLTIARTMRQRQSLL